MTERISEGDIIQHVVKIGIDTLPPIDRSNLLTRLNAFAEEALHKWPKMYQNFTSGGSFSISHEISSEANSSERARGSSFLLSDRGPIFVYPLVLPELHKTNVADQWEEWFREAFGFFFKKFPEIKVIRLGMVRELVFKTGEMSVPGILKADDEFAGGRLVRGQVNFEYETDDYNIIVSLAPATITKSLTLPVGQQFRKEEGKGLIVKLDVNNRVLRELEGTDIEGILETARSLWPVRLLDCVNGRFDS